MFHIHRWHTVHDVATGFTVGAHVLYQECRCGKRRTKRNEITGHVDEVRTSYREGWGEPDEQAMVESALKSP